MTTREALKEAKEIYEELAGTVGYTEEIPTQAEKVKAIIAIARYLMDKG